MSPKDYEDLTDAVTIEAALHNFRHTIRMVKGHPAVLMWAVGNEPNHAGHANSYAAAGTLGDYFDFLWRVAEVRDDEEGFGEYHPHPLLVPMADIGTFVEEVAQYDYATFDVWGIQPYRGDTFTDLFDTYVSEKPLLVSEYGMDAYQDVLRSARTSALVVDATNQAEGDAVQNASVYKLAQEIEAQDSRRSRVAFLATTLLRGTRDDAGGGYAVLLYDNRSRGLEYSVRHRTFESGQIRFDVAGLLSLSNSPRAVAGATTLGAMHEAEVNASSTVAECQTASGLALCADWNGRQIGTCYGLGDIDRLARRVMDAFGGGDCAREWACASVATCYHSANPRHWCARADRGVCEAAFDGCGASHAPSADVPPAWADAVERPPAPAGWVDADTPAGAATRTVNGEELTLVFSDEFNADGRDLGPGRDAKWEAVDLWYSATGDHEVYKPDGVRVEGGRAVISFDRNTTYDLNNVEKRFKSAMLQSWNKFCFTGGYLEARLNQPGSADKSGLWSAFWLLGNIGRAGYLDTTAGTWPFTYSTCDDAAARGQAHWPNSALPRQNLSACDDFSRDYGFAPNVGRGAAEVDVFELVVPWKGGAGGGRPAHVTTSLQLGPKIPPGTVHGAGPAGDCRNGSDTCTGIHFDPGNGYATGLNAWCMQPESAGDVLGGPLQVLWTAHSAVPPPGTTMSSDCLCCGKIKMDNVTFDSNILY